MTYRRDIDGLRAIAVLAVIFFHAEIPGFGGGYVGVDVFFVISGYLITQILAGSAHLPLGERLTDFYLRRARRILPALFATCLVVTTASVVILMPWDLATYGRYLAATPVFWINVTAWLGGGGYFGSKAVHVPIAHFWSIAIEEQFYVVYPITFALMTRYLPRWHRRALIALATVSFAVCVWGSYHAAAADYFLAPTRAWELLLGAVLAVSSQRSFKSKMANEVLAASALIVLACVARWYGPSLRYPGVYAMVPCAASAILIQTSRQQSTLAARVLALSPLVFTGRISYSLYLWHYPVLVLANYYLLKEVGGAALALLIAAVFMLALASWKWVEMPVRRRQFLKSNRRLVSGALIMSIAILGSGLLLWKSGGLGWRFPAETQVRGTAWLWEGDFLRNCGNLSLDKIASGSLCSVGPQDEAAVRGIVWGDSHAMVLLPAYERLAMAHHIRLYFAVRSACRPLVGTVNRLWTEMARVKCGGFNAAVAQAVRLLDPRLVILNAHWIDVDADLVSQPSTEMDPAESNFKLGLRATLTAIRSRDRSACAVLDVPEFQYDLPTALGVARNRGIAEGFLKLTRADAQNHFAGPERDIRALAQDRMLRYVDPKDILCDGGSCIFESHGQLLYGDGDHLSMAGAHFVESALECCFRDIAPAATD